MTKALESELAHTRTKINEISEALKQCDSVNREALEILMDVLQDSEDDILKELDLLQANSHA